MRTPVHFCALEWLLVASWFAFAACILVTITIVFESIDFPVLQYQVMNATKVAVPKSWAPPDYVFVEHMKTLIITVLAAPDFVKTC